MTTSTETLVLALTINGASAGTYTSYADLKNALSSLETSHTYMPKVLEIVGDNNEELATWICAHRTEIAGIRKTDKAAIQKQAIELLKAAGIDAKNVQLPEPTAAQIDAQVVERLQALSVGNPDLYNVLTSNLDALINIFKRQISDAALAGMAKFKADVEEASKISEAHGKVCRKMYKDYVSIRDNSDDAALSAFVERNI
jgi:bifunctional N-acetylglucosamine-1-phosphate-uridyltransferase/glucosamine-1-phosphate-acetyltransferase GlmU-like protein